MKHHSTHYEPTEAQIAANQKWADLPQGFRVVATGEAVTKIDQELSQLGGMVRSLRAFDDGAPGEEPRGLGNAAGNVFEVRVPEGNRAQALQTVENIRGAIPFDVPVSAVA